MPIINSQVKPFKAQAYHNGDFTTVTEESLKGKWSVFVFYPADFTFVCPTELGDLADRGTFVIDPDGIIQIVEIHPEGVGRNAAELLRKVKAAQYVRQHPNEVCPAKWEEGEETLMPSLDLVGKI